MSRIYFSSSVIQIPQKNITCPSGKLRTEFTSPIEKSTSPVLLDNTFFANCLVSIISVSDIQCRYANLHANSTLHRCTELWSIFWEKGQVYCGLPWCIMNSKIDFREKSKVFMVKSPTETHKHITSKRSKLVCKVRHTDKSLSSIFYLNFKLLVQIASMFPVPSTKSLSLSPKWPQKQQTKYVSWWHHCGHHQIYPNMYSQLSLRRTPLGPALSVHLREVSVL